MDTTEAQRSEIAKQQIAASIAGGIIAAMGRPVSMKEARKVYTDTMMSLFPQVGHSRQKLWQDTFDENAPYT